MRWHILITILCICSLTVFPGCPPEDLDDYYNIMLPKELEIRDNHYDVIIRCSLVAAKALISEIGKNANFDEADHHYYRVKRVLSIYKFYREGDILIIFDKVYGDASSPIWAHIFILRTTDSDTSVMLLRPGYSMKTLRQNPTSIYFFDWLTAIKRECKKRGINYEE